MNTNRTVIILVFLFIGLGGLYAQETVPAASGVATGSGGSTSYTIGQVTCSFYSGSTGSLTQGVQQPYEIFTTVGIELTWIDLEIIAYPNPTQYLLKLNLGNYYGKKVFYKLYDLHGRLLKHERVVDPVTTIGVQELAEGTYMLNVLDDNSLIKTFRIIKR